MVDFGVLHGRGGDSWAFGWCWVWPGASRSTQASREGLDVAAAATSGVLVGEMGDFVRKGAPDLAGGRRRRASWWNLVLRS